MRADRSDATPPRPSPPPPTRFARPPRRAASWCQLDDFLMNAMNRLNDAPARHLSLREDFRRAMSLAWDLFGSEAFRRLGRPGPRRWRSPVNKPLFESLGVALAEVPEDRVEGLRGRRDEVVADLRALMDDAEFCESISVGTQAARLVRVRFGRMRELVGGTGHDAR